MRDVPVYLFLGFLESGKTKFIQETLEDTRFNQGEKTVILMCEEGIEEYDLAAFKSGNVFIETVNGEAELTAERLSDIEKRLRPDRVMCEYNGMFLVQKLFDALPENWQVVQSFMFVDSSTFLSYNGNMRQLVYDKLNVSDLVAFNRFDDKYERDIFHKTVRAVSRRTEIIFEYVDGTVVPDDTVDPLPFDLDAPVVEISDRDYAIWYQDLCEEMSKYDGKTLRLHVRLIKNKLLPDAFIAGRDLMSCCVEDIRLAAVACRNPENIGIEDGEWYEVTGKLEVRFSKAYNKRGPVLTVEKAEKADAPEQPVATFY
ncbi:MAG: GTPase [Clostridia bacterium]|nr:GTPase [Clostridia bacterium]